MTIQSLSKDWIATPFVSLLFQNLICEERTDVRDASLSGWKTALSILSDIPGRLEKVITHQHILNWYAVMMTPLGVPIDVSAFYNPSVHNEGNGAVERHNVDKNMIAQDLSLVTVDVIIRARLASATALAFLMTCWPAEVSICSIKLRFQLDFISKTLWTRVSDLSSSIILTQRACFRSFSQPWLQKSGPGIMKPQIQKNITISPRAPLLHERLQ